MVAVKPLGRDWKIHKSHPLSSSNKNTQENFFCLRLHSVDVQSNYHRHCYHHYCLYQNHIMYYSYHYHCCNNYWSEIVFRGCAEAMYKHDYGCDREMQVLAIIIRPFTKFLIFYYLSSLITYIKLLLSDFWQKYQRKLFLLSVIIDYV